MNCCKCNKNMGRYMVSLGNQIYCIFCYNKVPINKKRELMNSDRKGGEFDELN